MMVEASKRKEERSEPIGTVLASQVKEHTCQGYRRNHDRRQAPPPDEVVNHVFSFEIKCAFRAATRVWIEHVAAITTCNGVHIWTFG